MDKGAFAEQLHLIFGTGSTRWVIASQSSELCSIHVLDKAHEK